MAAESYLVVAVREIRKEPNPLDRQMFVDETWSPDPPSGNCTNERVDDGDANTNAYGICGPDLYTMSPAGPAGCSSQCATR